MGQAMEVHAAAAHLATRTNEHMQFYVLASKRGHSVCSPSPDTDRGSASLAAVPAELAVPFPS